MTRRLLTPQNRRKFLRGAGAWLFGLALSIFLGTTWGRTIVSDGDTLADAARPLAETTQVAAIVSNWLREELVAEGVPEGPARSAADEFVRTDAVASAMARLAAEVTLAAASPGTDEAVVDAAAILLPAVPELTHALAMATGVPVDEASVEQTVRNLDPIVVARAGQPRPIGPASTAASRLGVASVLGLATMVVVGWALAATGEDRLVELRKLLNRVALGSLSFAVMLRLGSWVFSPRGGKAPVSEAISVITAAKWMVPFVIALIAGALALAAHETRRAVRRRRQGRLRTVTESATEPIEGAV